MVTGPAVLVQMESNGEGRERFKNFKEIVNDLKDVVQIDRRSYNSCQISKWRQNESSSAIDIIFCSGVS